MNSMILFVFSNILLLIFLGTLSLATSLIKSMSCFILLRLPVKSKLDNILNPVLITFTPIPFILLSNLDNSLKVSPILNNANWTSSIFIDISSVSNSIFPRSSNCCSKLWITVSTSIFSTLPLFWSSFIKSIRESRFPPSIELKTTLRVALLELVPGVVVYLANISSKRSP